MNDDSEKDDDKQAFAQAMRDVILLNRTQKVMLSSSNHTHRDKPLPAIGDIDQPSSELIPSVAAIPAESIISYHCNALSALQWRRFRRGQLPIEARLDIHGLTVADAQPNLRRFIERHFQLNHRCVLIVHGKGQGLLKGLVHDWLPSQPIVLAYHTAVTKHGGGGAVYVYLKSAY